MSTALSTLTSNFAARFGLGDNKTELIETLKATAFKGGNVTDAQMTALMLVAQQYNLNPWLNEIYAFPNNKGIVPIVGVDGWARIMNDHPQFDGIEFDQNDEACTCIIFRKDRSHAIKTTEYLLECKKDGSVPWKTHPRRMLRHKAMIQCARLAFGFGGIYDQEEAERIVDGTVIDGTTGEIIDKKQTRPELKECSAGKFDEKRDEWRAIVESGKKSANDFITTLSTKTILTEDQKLEIASWEKIAYENS